MKNIDLLASRFNNAFELPSNVGREHLTKFINENYTLDKRMVDRLIYTILSELRLMEDEEVTYLTDKISVVVPSHISVNIGTFIALRAIVRWVNIFRVYPSNLMKTRHGVIELHPVIEGLKVNDRDFSELFEISQHSANHMHRLLADKRTSLAVADLFIQPLGSVSTATVVKLFNILDVADLAILSSALIVAGHSDILQRGSVGSVAAYIDASDSSTRGRTVEEDITGSMRPPVETSMGEAASGNYFTGCRSMHQEQPQLKRPNPYGGPEVVVTSFIAEGGGELEGNINLNPSYEGLDAFDDGEVLPDHPVTSFEPEWKVYVDAKGIQIRALLPEEYFGSFKMKATNPMVFVEGTVPVVTTGGMLVIYVPEGFNPSSDINRIHTSGTFVTEEGLSYNLKQSSFLFSLTPDRYSYLLLGEDSDAVYRRLNDSILRSSHTLDVANAAGQAIITVVDTIASNIPIVQLEAIYAKGIEFTDLDGTVATKSFNIVSNDTGFTVTTFVIVPGSDCKQLIRTIGSETFTFDVESYHDDMYISALCRKAVPEIKKPTTTSSSISACVEYSNLPMKDLDVAMRTKLISMLSDCFKLIASNEKGNFTFPSLIVTGSAYEGDDTITLNYKEEITSGVLMYAEKLTVRNKTIGSKAIDTYSIEALQAQKYAKVGEHISSITHIPNEEVNHESILTLDVELGAGECISGAYSFIAEIFNPGGEIVATAHARRAYNIEHKSEVRRIEFLLPNGFPYDSHSVRIASVYGAYESKTVAYSDIIATLGKVVFNVDAITTDGRDLELKVKRGKDTLQYILTNIPTSEAVEESYINFSATSPTAKLFRGELVKTEDGGEHYVLKLEHDTISSLRSGITYYGVVEVKTVNGLHRSPFTGKIDK